MHVAQIVVIGERKGVKRFKPAVICKAALVGFSDFNHFKDLMPEQVVDWKSDSDSCSFTLKGMTSLGMKYDQKIPYSEIVIVPDGKVSFDFRLICNLSTQNEQGVLQLGFEADLNPFMKMMAEKPLQNFLDLLINKAENM